MLWANKTIWSKGVPFLYQRYLNPNRKWALKDPDLCKKRVLRLFQAHFLEYLHKFSLWASLNKDTCMQRILVHRAKTVRWGWSFSRVHGEGVVLSDIFKSPLCHRLSQRRVWPKLPVSLYLGFMKDECCLILGSLSWIIRTSHRLNSATDHPIAILPEFILLQNHKDNSKVLSWESWREGSCWICEEPDLTKTLSSFRQLPWWVTCSHHQHIGLQGLPYFTTKEETRCLEH